MAERLLYKPHKEYPGTLMIVPENQTGAAIAERLKWPDGQWASFPESKFDPACYAFPQGFTISSGPLGIGVAVYDAELAKPTAIMMVNVQADADAKANLNGLSRDVYLAQVALPAEQRLPRYQAIIDANNAIAQDAIQKEEAITSAESISAVQAIVSP